MTRAVNIHLSEEAFGLLAEAARRPGVNQNMIIEAALERFFEQDSSVEKLADDQLCHIHNRIECLANELRTISETVTLHARYHLLLTAPASDLQRRETAFGGQFDIAEATDPQSSAQQSAPAASIDQARPRYEQNSPNLEAKTLNYCPSPARTRPLETRESVQSQAAAQEGGSNRNFRHLPNAFC
jgi:hypothetical protein